ncbi:hypothetical protein P9139_20950 [Curtobacterium flaccumfaciens]|nr:hypothetical protein P9139_20950 [Curtobacterium flaccumfaciens]
MPSAPGYTRWHRVAHEDLRGTPPRSSTSTGLRRHQDGASGRSGNARDPHRHDHLPDTRDRPPRPCTPGDGPRPGDRRRGPLARLFLGEREDARWLRPAFWALLALTAVVYLWDLSASGYANSFYAAAVQAGTKSWEAFFFGSLDSSNFITVDKPRRRSG